MEEKRSIFRKESLERISSPEQVNDYIKVASSGIWLVLSAVVLLLLGVICWGIAGRLENHLMSEAVAVEGEVSVVIEAEEIGELAVGSKAAAGDVVGEVTEIAAGTDGTYTVAAYIPDLPDGRTQVTFTTGYVAPVTFLL